MDKTIRNSFEQNLIDNGYKIFKNNFNNSIRGFQKKYTDEKGVKYFLNCYHYNYGEQIPNSSALKIDSYCWGAQFNLQNGKCNNTVDLHFSGKFIEDDYDTEISSLPLVEAFYETFFRNFNCEYYESNTGI